MEVADGSGAGALTTEITVVVELNDLNDNSPIFNPGSYPYSADEDDPVGTVVGAVTATDLDETTAHNSISYTLTDDKFDVNAHNGDVFIKAQLDNEALGG